MKVQNANSTRMFLTQTISNMLFQTWPAPGLHTSDYVLWTQFEHRNDYESTLGGKRHWPTDLHVDPSFQISNGLEWLVENDKIIAITVMLLRVWILLATLLKVRDGLK